MTSPEEPRFPEYRSRKQARRQAQWHSYPPPSDEGPDQMSPWVSAPKPGRSRRMVAMVVVLVVLILVGILFGIGVGRGGGPAEVPNDGPDAVRAVDWLMSADRLSAILEAKIERNRDAVNSALHPLWDSIEYNDHNRTALYALNYFLIDLKVATGMGVDRAEIREYQELINEYEERFWAGQPLGRDVMIRYEDRTFSYDGSTGEGGWTED